MYGATNNKIKLKKSRKFLEYIYSKMPETKGCMENINKPIEEGGCNSWCCEFQQPQVLHVEFLNTWHYVTSNWTDNKFIALLERSLRAYLFDKDRKGCVFWDKNSKLCQQHDSRAYSCRIYGIVPDEEFRTRYERLKVLYPETRYQCNLVFTSDGSEVTTKDTDSWWNDVKMAENSIGIPTKIVNDDIGGSYRRYYEHIILKTMGEYGISMLSDMREHGNEEQKEKIIETVINSLQNWTVYKNESKTG